MSITNWFKKTFSSKPKDPMVARLQLAPKQGEADKRDPEPCKPKRTKALWRRNVVKKARKNQRRMHKIAACRPA